MGAQTESVAHSVSLLTGHDIYLLKEGAHCKLYEKLGAHVNVIDGRAGVSFAVLAPNARQVSVLASQQTPTFLPQLLRVRSTSYAQKVEYMAWQPPVLDDVPVLPPFGLRIRTVLQENVLPSRPQTGSGRSRNYRNLA